MTNKRFTPSKGLALAVATAAGTAIFFMSHHTQAAPASPAAAPVALELSSSDLAVVTAGTQVHPIALSGSLNPVHHTVIDSDVEAVALQVMVRPGDEVKRGQILAQLDKRDIENQMHARAAQLEKSRAELDLASKNRDRNSNLLKQHFISPTNFDASEGSYAAAQAQVKADEAQLAIARRALDLTAIRAPFAGVISERTIEPGARIGANQKAFALVDLHDLEFEAKVPLADLPLIRIGQQASFRIEGFSDQPFKGRVARIAPVAETGSRMVPVYVLVNNPDNVLKGGMFAQGRIIVASDEHARILPMAALRTVDNSPSVLAVENNKLVAHRVEVDITNPIDKTVSIKRGVELGQQVVIAKVETVKAGQLVSMPAVTQPVVKARG